MANGILEQAYSGIPGYTPFDPGRMILQGLEMGRRRKMQDAEFQQQQSQRDIQALGMIGQMLDGADPSQQQAIYQSGVQFLGDQGFDVSDMPGELDSNTLNKLSLAKRFALQARGGVPAAIKERDDLIKRLPVNPDGTLKDPKQMTAAERAIAIEAGLLPRATGSAAITTATTPGLTDQVADSEADISGAKAGASEVAKLTAQLKLKPQVEAAVRDAVNAANARAEVAKEERSNARALDVYTTGMTGLTNALGGTETGPFVGWLPALTSNQQIADGAIAAMAPILKSMFRASGEGNFTDQDQKLLLDMIPTRKDRPEARISKLQNIDAIIRAKLGSVQPQGAAPTQQPTTQAQTQSQFSEGQTATNPQTGEKLIFRNGKWERM